MNDKFCSKKVSYQPGLSKVQKYKLKKANPNIPEMFFEGVKAKNQVISVINLIQIKNTHHRVLCSVGIKLFTNI